MAVSLVSNYFSFSNRIDLTCNTPEPPLKFYDNFESDFNENGYFKQQDIGQMEDNFYHQHHQQNQQSFEEIRGTYNNTENEENFQNFPEYQTNYVDSPPDSKEAWPIDDQKTIMNNNNASSGQEGLASSSRKRRMDWSTHNNDVESSSKIVHVEKEKDHRRKSQGRFNWPEDIDIDLSNELPVTNSYLSDSLLNFPVFKQEMPSPKIHEITKNEMKVSVNDNGNIGNVDKNCGFRQDQGEQSGNGMTNLQNFLQQNGYDGNGSASQQNDNILKNENMSDDNRFQYVLAAATSIATKNNEESLTYLNQGQSYEIKLKKLGDLSPFRGKILKSIIKICFQERRLQYMEREQMQLWQASRPGERILDVDIPLSYGLIQVNQSPTTNANLLNTVEVFWDPMKEVGIYIKVNCISTEFTPKKHGGEKGVPFRIQVETCIDYTFVDTCKDIEQSTKLLHAAACQIKVFKLKGADRKHKQDREKIQKRPLTEQEKYQRSCDCTILNDIPCEIVMSPIVGSFSPEHIKRNISPILTSSNSPVHATKYDQIMFSTYRNNGPSNVPSANNPIVTSTNSMGKIMDQNVLSPTQTIDNDDFVPVVTKDSSPATLAQWLNFHRLNAYGNTFAHFSGSDLLRMSKEDLMKICGLADGIRMFNILHSKAITPRLTLFVCFEANIFHAIYLHTNTVQELIYKLQKTPGFSEHNQQFDASPSPSSPTSSSFLEGKLNIFLNGPNNIHVLLTDEVLNNLQDESLYHMDFQPKGILMKALNKSSSSKNNDKN